MKLYVFHDGWCPMCRKSAIRIKRLNWLGLVKFYSFRDPEIMLKYKLRTKNPEKEIVGLNYRTGNYYQGIDTILQIIYRIPLLWFLIPILLVIIKLGYGDKWYKYIANNRKIVPVGQCDQKGCVVHNNKEKTK